MEFTVPIKLGKRAEIELLNEQRWSAAKIARKVRCSISTVYRVRAEIEARNQMNLPL